LNLVTGYFGMNFKAFPLLHGESSLAWASLFMLLIAVGLAGYFWRHHYFGSQERRLLTTVGVQRCKIACSGWSAATTPAAHGASSRVSAHKTSPSPPGCARCMEVA
jgi:hypothetical protein